MTPQDRSLKHHDIYRKTKKNMKKDENVFFKVETREGGASWDESPRCRVSSSGGGCCPGDLTVSPVGWWLFATHQAYTCETLFGTISTCAAGKVLYPVQEFFLLHPSGRRICISQPTDLDIITSEREITLVEQLAPLAICCTSARFMAVCGPEIQSVPLSPSSSRQKN